VNYFLSRADVDVIGGAEGLEQAITFPNQMGTQDRSPETSEHLSHETIQIKFNNKNIHIDAESLLVPVCSAVKSSGRDSSVFNCP